jgi:hypothetical protein
LLALDRRTIRSRFEERFSSARMAADYIRVYQKILRKNSAPEPQPSSLAALPATTNGHGHSREVVSAVRQDVETKKRDAIAAMRNAQP